jgi:arsenate reductase (thioredoxin)
MKKLTLLIVGFLVSLVAVAQNKKILFVCEHGSAKSMIATAYFNKFAKENNLPWEAFSSGTDPDKEISPKTKQLLEKDQLYDKNLKPHKLAQADVSSADQVIMFYSVPANISVKDNTQYWLGINAVNGDFQKLRDEIVSKVVSPLIDSLKKK